MKPRSEIDLEVRYAETDQMGVVHHANYLVWFEVARTRLCEREGHPYAAIEEQGYWLVVTGATVRYRRGARYGETVQVSCQVDWVGTRGLRFGYEVHCNTKRLATGTTEHVWVDRRSGRHCRIPQHLQATFLKLAEQESLLVPRPSG